MVATAAEEDVQVVAMVAEEDVVEAAVVVAEETKTVAIVRSSECSQTSFCFWLIRNCEHIRPSRSNT